MGHQSLFEDSVMQWHTSRGGFPGDPSGHALRMLGEMVELCVASGASWKQITDTVGGELNKAQERGEFDKKFGLLERTEEFVDVQLLSIIYDKYFIPHNLVATEAQRKLAICEARDWQVDTDGVLWRPGRVPAGKLPGSAERS